MDLKFGIEKCTTYKVVCGDVDFTDITVENHGGSQYTVYRRGEEFDVFNYSGDKPFEAINEYLKWYAKENGYTQDILVELPKQGDIVWVRDTDNEDWAISHFLDYEPNQPLPYVASTDATIGSAFNYVQMTTKNPYIDK
jgi:hypothetical protein